MGGWMEERRHNERDGVSNHQRLHCLHNHLFGRRSKKISKLRVTGLCAVNSSETGELPPKKAVNAENVSIWWRHHGGKWSAKCNRRSSISLFKSSAPVQHIAITHSNDDMIANLTYYRASSVNVLVNRMRWYFNNDDKALVNLAVNLKNWHLKYRCRTDTGHKLVHQCPADVLLTNMVDYQQETCWFKG